MKNGWFGTVNGGYGTDGRYEGSFNVSTFTNNQQISIIGGANNTNDLGFGDSGRGRFANFGPSGGITSSQRWPQFQCGTHRLVTLRRKYLLFPFRPPGHKPHRHAQFLFPDSVSYSNSGSSSIDRGHNVSGNFRLEWKIDANNTPRLPAIFLIQLPTLGTERHRAAPLRRRRTYKSKHQPHTALQQRRTSWNADGNLIFNHEFPSRPGRSFSIRPGTHSHPPSAHHIVEPDSILSLGG